MPIALSLLLPVLNIFTVTENVDFFSVSFMARWFFASSILYILWYILAFVSKTKNRYKGLVLALTILLVAFLVYFLFLMIIFKVSNHIKWVFIAKIILASVLFLTVQYALRASASIAQLKLEKEQIQKENYLAQLQELRLKVDPHFLFNSMNTLRILIRQNHQQSEEFVMNLSNFYRQTLKLNDSKTVCLDEELDVLKSYLFLMQTRNEGNLKVVIDVKDEFQKFLIPTLSLQIVVENCFKHNQISVAHPLEIKIRTTDDSYISIENNLQPKLSKAENSGYGLCNIQKRYKLMGVDNGLIVNKTKEFFKVKLKLTE